MGTYKFNYRLLVIFTIFFLSLCSFTFADCPSADFSGDCRVDFEDLNLLAAEWLNDCDLSNNLCGGADLIGDGRIDFLDFNVMASQWQDKEIHIVWVDINDSGAGMKDELGNPISYSGFSGKMSKYETTNAQYCKFLNDAFATGDITVSLNGNYIYGANGSDNGVDFEGQIYYYLEGSGFGYDGAINGGASRINYTGSFFAVDSGFEQHPVTYVSWYGATAFCNYYGFRLPNEWQWQAVADYDSSYIYGCGDNISNSMANYRGSDHPNGTTVVGAFGTSGYGLADMAGNVWEWTDSWYDNFCVFRGGGWYDSAQYCTVSSRYNYYPTSMFSYLGFRVCR